MTDNSDKKVKDLIIEYYNDLINAAIKREDYETAIKYKKWIQNLEKIKEDNNERIF